MMKARFQRGGWAERIRRWRFGRGAKWVGAVMLVAMGWIVCGAPATPVERAGIRVLTWNIRHGEGMDGKIDLERIGRWIAAQDVDLVALQEVDRGVARTAGRDLPAELATLTGMTCVFSNNYHFQGGEYGNAILSRLPIQGWTNRHYRMLHDGEQRGLLEARVEWQGRLLRFFSTHLDFRRDPTERLAHVEEIRKAVGDGGEAVIVAGDFNDFPRGRVHEALSTFMTDVWELAGAGPGHTIPSTGADRRIDYVWMVSGGGLRVRGISVGRSEYSDHLPVLAEFEWEVGGGEKE